MTKSAAQTLVAKADKKANSSGGWFSSSDSKWEEAGDLYQQAANSFKIDKLFKEAGDAFAREAECREKGGEQSDAANAWWNAAKSYKMGFPDLAVAALSQTITFLTKAGRFRQAADREKEIGQIHLQEGKDSSTAGDWGGAAKAKAEACKSFDRAAEWYTQEDAKATANACFKDAADLHAELGNYREAISRYEQVAKTSLGSDLTKFSVKEYLLRAGLCAVCTFDVPYAKTKMAEYTDPAGVWASSEFYDKRRREAPFVLAIIDAVEDCDEEVFLQTVNEYDQVMKLDNWKNGMVLKIQRWIEEHKESDPDLK